MKIHAMIERRQAGPSPQPKRPAGVMHCLYKSTALILITATLIACGDSERRPSPVERKDGMAYIPIDNTAFLIPEKTWLTNYGIRKTDGQVDSFFLHATIPDVQPWSPERNEEMYWPAGPGRKLVISIEGNKQKWNRAFPTEFNSLFQGKKFVEEPSDETDQGLRRFRQLVIFNPPEIELKEYRMKYGDENIRHLLSQHGKPDKDYIFYAPAENNHTRYIIKCDDREDAPPFRACHILLPMADSLMIDIYFSRTGMNHAATIAERTLDKLYDLERHGLAYKSQNK